MNQAIGLSRSVASTLPVRVSNGQSDSYYFATEPQVIENPEMGFSSPFFITSL